MVPANPIAAVTHPNPYPYYAGLATHAPMYRDDAIGLWVAASAEAVTAVLTSDRCRVRPPGEPVPHRLLGSPAGDIFGALVRMNDGAGHCPLKRAISATFDAIDVQALATRSQTWAGNLVDQLRPHQDRSQLTELALQLPVHVIADLLGAPRGLLPQITHWTADLVSCFAPTSTDEQVARGKRAAGQLHALVQTLLDAPPAAASGTLLAALTAQARSAGCTDLDVVAANAIGLLSQAYEATAGLLGATLLVLARQPDLHAQVLDDPDLLSPVIEEVLRYDPPVQNTRRFVAEDGIVAGQPLRAGEAVLVLLAAANHDPAANQHPQQFDPFRSKRRVFTFGIGAHACPGATVAAVIARAGVRAVLEEGLDLASLAEGVCYRPSINTRIPLWRGKERAS